MKRLQANIELRLQRRRPRQTCFPTRWVFLFVSLLPLTIVWTLNLRLMRLQNINTTSSSTDSPSLKPYFRQGDDSKVKRRSQSSHKNSQDRGSVGFEHKNSTIQHSNNLYAANSSRTDVFYLSYDDIDAALHPLYPTYRRNTDKPVAVTLLQGESGSLQSEIALSKYIKLYKTATYHSYSQNVKIEKHMSSDDTAPTHRFYLIDWESLQRDCHLLNKLLQYFTIHTNEPLVYLDLTSSTRVVTCLPAEVTMGDISVVTAKRSMISDRFWDYEASWVHPGQVHIDTLTQYDDNHRVVHFPLYLRDEYVRRIYEVTDDHSALKSGKFASSTRSLDVYHAWKKGTTLHYRELRNQISKTIMDMNGTKLHDSRSMKWLVRQYIDEDTTAPSTVSLQYVETLLDAKIVVIAQPDEWEDHARLLESMASGALVLSDAMLLPPRGIVNGTNIVFYDSPDSLQHMILYYLEHSKERIKIAQRGAKLVWEKHRFAYRLENFVFGTTNK